MLKTVDTIISPEWIIPIIPANKTLSAHSVVIDGGLIIDIISTDEVAKKYKATNHLKLDNHVLMPGLINTHTHSPMSLLRGMADDIPLMQWLNEYIWPMEKRWLSEDFIVDGTELALAEMIKSGTTCFNEHYFFMNQIAKTTDQAGMRATIGGMVIDLETNFANHFDQYIEKAIAFNKTCKQYSTINFSLAPHSPYALDDEQLTVIHKLSLELDCSVHIHLHETTDEIDQSIKKYAMRPIERLGKIGMLSSKLLAAHSIHLTSDEIQVLSETQTNVVTCTECNLKLASGFCPVSKLTAAGVNVAIGTDGPCSNNDLDMFSELQTLTLINKALSKDLTTLPAHELLRMATINGAKALGLDKIIGSIEKGKQADLIAIDLDYPATQPTYNPASQLIYAASRDQVNYVWCNGRLLLDKKQLTTLDESLILSKTRQWSKKIASK